MLFAWAIVAILLGAEIQQHRSDDESFKKCVSEQIQIARQNWDIGADGNQDDDEYWTTEFQEQDDLSGFITEGCFKEL